jgi:ribosomal protein S14
MSETITKPPISMPLTTADRCDRCGAAARVRAVLSTGSELLFCRHHFNEHEARLVDIGATVITNEEELV